MSRAHRRNKVAVAFYAMVIPMACLFFLFHTLPFLQGVFYSFTNWQGYGVWHFIGWKNYIRVFTNPTIRDAYFFTFKFAICATVLTNVLSLALALGLTAKIKFRGFLRATFFLPWVLSALVVSYVFKFIFSNVLPQIGAKLSVGFLATNILGTYHAWIGVLIVAVWQGLAFTSLIFMSGLQTVGAEVDEAATVDGATGWKKFWNITFPLILPFVTINLVLSFKNFMGVFDQIMGMTNGGPGNSSTSVTVQIYGALNGGSFSVMQANSVILFVIVAIITLIQLRVLQSREDQLS
jgi:raffinose/stachyose/melibiose transport system permease protein